MPNSSTISSKGQITVPIEIRQRLGLKAGDRVEFVIEEGKTILRPNRNGEENPFKKYIGSVPVFKSREEINDWVRSLRDEEEESTKSSIRDKGSKG